MKGNVISFAVGLSLLTVACGEKEKKDVIKGSSLFMELPESCPTPDGMAVDPDGNLILACPNFADPSRPACLMKIDSLGNISKWLNVPVLEETGHACPMGIAFNDRGELYICDNQGWAGADGTLNKGRLLKLVFDKEGQLLRTVTVASGMEHPNGVRVRDGYIYVTQSILSPLSSSDKTVSGVYRFSEGEENITVKNDTSDANLLLTVVTVNPEVRYGIDGIDFDKEGNMYLGNFGDASIVKVTFDGEGGVPSQSVWACDTTQMKSVDGICFDPSDGNLYVADFSANALARVTPDGVITRIAQSPDCDGSDGGLDQPGEPIIWRGRLIVSCFDAVTGPDKINTGHDRPFTLAEIIISKNQ